MRPRPEERRQRRRGHPLRTIVVAVWAVGAIVAVLAAFGPFWRDAGFWMDRAMAHAQAREWPQALHNVGRALDGAPNDPSILTFAGHVHRELGAWPEAAGYFERALEVDPGRHEAALGLAEVRLAMGDSPGAVAALGQTRSTDASDEERARAVALAELAGRPDLALAMLEAAPAPGPLAERARLARNAGDHEREVVLLEAALASEGLNSAQLDALRAAHARALRASGREQEALAAFGALHSDGSLDRSDALTYAWMLNERGDHRGALRVLEPHVEGSGGATRSAGVNGTPPATDAEILELAAWSALWADDLERARRHIGAVADASAEPGTPDGSARVTELRNLLATGEARRERARAEGEAARLRALPPADPAAALEYWRNRLADAPDDLTARAEVVALLEAHGRFEDAREALLAGRTFDEVGAAGGATAVHAARLSLWAGAPDDAVALLSPKGGPPELLAEALLGTGRPQEAYQVLMAERGPAAPALDAGTLLLRARVADAAERPAEAAEQLAALARTRPLAEDEQLWWAGLLWRADRLEDARRGYRAVAELRPDDPAVQLAIGDLGSALDDAASAEVAYRRALALSGPGGPAGRGLALALLRQGRADEAVAAYRDHLAAAPDDGDGWLSLARALAGSGEFVDAGAAYERHAERVLPIAPALADEVARVWMAAGAHERAEPWARLGAAGGNPLAGARHAHLLTLLGRFKEASGVIEGLEEAPMREGDAQSLEGALLEAWTERLRNRSLAALSTLEGRIASADTSALARDARVFLAEVAEGRGDVRAARTHVLAARAAGATDHDLRHVDQALHDRTRPRLGGGYMLGSDARALDVRSAWGRASFRPGSGGTAALAAELRHRKTSQHGASSGGTTIEFRADSLNVESALQFDFMTGFETTDGHGARMIGGVSGRLETLEGIRLELDGGHLPVWSEARRRGAPEYARVVELGTLDPVLMVTEGRASVATSPQSPLHAGFLLEGGAARYSDGNRRLFGYGQWTLPLQADATRSFALAPNLYAEGFRTRSSGYASPSSFVAAGVAAEARHRWGGGATLEGRLNPHFYDFPGDRGFGVEGIFGFGIQGGFGATRVEARYLKQGSAYDLFRIGTELSVPLGRR